MIQAANLAGAASNRDEKIDRMKVRDELMSEAHVQCSHPKQMLPCSLFVNMTIADRFRIFLVCRAL